MNEIVENDVINIENMIYEFDGKEVMLDTDLAKLYHVETKRINEIENKIEIDKLVNEVVKDCCINN